MASIVFQVLMHVPDGAEMPDPEELENALELALEEARSGRQFPGVSHLEVVFEDVV